MSSLVIGFLIALLIVCITVIKVVAIYKENNELKNRWKTRSIVLEDIIYYSFSLNDFTDRFSNLKQLSDEEKSTLFYLKKSINDVIKTIKDYERKSF